MNSICIQASLLHLATAGFIGLAYESLAETFGWPLWPGFRPGRSMSWAMVSSWVFILSAAWVSWKLNDWPFAIMVLFGGYFLASKLTALLRHRVQLVWWLVPLSALAAKYESLILHASRIKTYVAELVPPEIGYLLAAIFGVVFIFAAVIAIRQNKIRSHNQMLMEEFWERQQRVEEMSPNEFFQHADKVMADYKRRNGNRE